MKMQFPLQDLKGQNSILCESNCIMRMVVAKYAIYDMSTFSWSVQKYLLFTVKFEYARYQTHPSPIISNLPSKVPFQVQLLVRLYDISRL